MEPFTDDGVPIRRLFVGSIPDATTEEELTTLFSAYGKVEACSLIPSRNFAFVTFTIIEDALKALKASQRRSIHLNGGFLYVRPGYPRNQPDHEECQFKSDHKKIKFTEISTQYELNEESKIHRLNDDCLIQIFSFLPIADRVRFERVCKRWRLISQASWSSFKKLDLTPSTWGHNAINTLTIQKVLIRTGEFLTHIDLSTGNAERLSRCTLGVIGSLCPNLQDIDVAVLSVPSGGIEALAKSCTKIIKFSLGPISNSCDTNLSALFTKNKNLRYLKLLRNNITGKCLLDIPSDIIQEICLDECRNISSCHFSQAIQKFENLHTLSLKNCMILNDQAVKAICSRIDRLKILHFSNCALNITENAMMLITALINLETLNISQNSCVNDPVLVAIGKKCKQLKNVDISSCEQVSNEGLFHITSLPKLEHLKISYLSNVTDSALTNMPNLKTLECRYCRSIGNTGLISLIEESHYLELIDLSRCNNVDNAFVEAVIKATVNRTNGVVCEVYVGGSGINVTSIVEESPLLKVIQQDLSEYHLIVGNTSLSSDEDIYSENDDIVPCDGYGCCDYNGCSDEYFEEDYPDNYFDPYDEHSDSSE